MSKKPITPDDLARLMSKGFDGVQVQLSEITKRVTAVEKTMATKADLERLATKADLAATKDTIIEGVAMFMAKFVPRFVDLTEIDERLSKLEKHTGLRK